MSLSRRTALGLGLAGGAGLLVGCSSPTIVDTGIAPDVPTRVSTLWSNRADGPMPAAGDDGTPFSVILSGPTERPAIRGGALVGNLPAAPGATYVGQRLPAPVTRIGARFGFGPGDVGGAIALVAFTGENPPRGNLHVVFTPDRLLVGVVDAEGVQEIARKSYTDPLPQDDTLAQADVRRAGETVWVNAPDGTVHRFDDPRFASPAGVIATWEFFKLTADSADVRMAATWAG